MSLTMLEYEPRRVPDRLDEAGIEEARSAALDNRIEALKTLALTLMSEIEALEKSREGAPPERKFSLQEEVRRFEVDMIRCALIRTGGRQRRAARMLGVNAATLNAKIKRYGIYPETLMNSRTIMLQRAK